MDVKKKPKKFYSREEIKQIEANNERIEDMKDELNNYLWEFELKHPPNQKFQPVSHLVMWNYEKEYQEALQAGKPKHNFVSNEPRQFNSTVQEFLYDCEFNQFHSGEVGFQKNQKTGMIRKLRRWKHWNESTEGYGTDPWKDDDGNAYGRPTEFFNLPAYIDTSSLQVKD